MLEFRDDAPIGMLVFWSIALVVWLAVKFGSRKSDVKEELKRKNRENSE